jgi:hypothetical protein
MKRTPIWTEVARKLLFEELVTRFGPYSEWEKIGSPGRDLDKKFERFCESMAELVGANSAEAVKHQIRFGLPIPGIARWQGSGHAMTAILCLAASYQAGFIRSSDLPDLIATRRPKSNQRKKINPTRIDKTNGIERIMI